MEQSAGKIGLKEYIALAIIMISPKVVDDTPAILFESLFNAAWMTPLLNGIFVILPIYLLIRVVTNSKQNNLFDIFDSLFGSF
ncbi:hypothetical protein [Ornithinibacillus halotolerans]|uniref:Uncharacterized protein n=1 Tax=Ornithinibacillus halotolerans TaxID=1274357 RepID=A0A916S818_9BACI|nr:hypothetical protein [Ornithinibacillus halotolerans]GGA87582.1 hypothetical protein GCM10008025_32960 [Ornithinibacillus halotolerans]